MKDHNYCNVTSTGVQVYRTILLAIICAVLSFSSGADVVVPADRVKHQISIFDLGTGTVVGHLKKGASATYIDTIPYYYVVALPDGTRGRVSKAWADFVEGSLTSTLRIATFNIKDFGPTKARKPAVMAELAAIVRSYDVVAVQEISDIHQRVPELFLAAINTGGVPYAYLLSERGGQQPDDRASQEQYAFYYNTETIKALDSGVLFDDSQEDLFQREPFMARFGSTKAGFTFVLMTVHTQPLAAVAEIKALHKVFEDAHARYVGEDDYMALGDFNAGCDYAEPSDFEGEPIVTAYHWLIPDSADTNVSTHSRCAYDRMVITSGMVSDFTGQWGIGTV